MSEKRSATFKTRILIFCALVALIITGIIAVGVHFSNNLYQDGKDQLLREANIAVDAFAEHTLQIVNQVDSLLHGVRMVYLGSNSMKQTQDFIDGLSFDKSTIDNIYVIDPDGNVTGSHDDFIKSANVSDRDYYLFHRSNPNDSLYISPVEVGRVTGRNHFRISRRISNPDGTFGGIVLATVNPESFTKYFREISIGPQNVASLLGTLDKRFRARIPEPDPAAWKKPVETILWKALEADARGRFENFSPLDNIRRFYTYHKIGSLPLVMVVGFSEEDVWTEVGDKKKSMFLAEVVLIIFVLALSSAFIVAFISRDKLAAAKITLESNNLALTNEIAERKKVEEEKSGLIVDLQKALDQVKKLSGFLPICSSCKKIRDDQGYWHQVEKYVRDHSEAEFSHSICPDCIKKLYPEHAEKVIKRINNVTKKED